MSNQIQFEEVARVCIGNWPLYGYSQFFNFNTRKNGEIAEQVPNLYWQNLCKDGDTPYNTPFFGKKWQYVSDFYVSDQRIIDYLAQRSKVECNCECEDDCNPKTCKCYKKLSTLKFPTYRKDHKSYCPDIIEKIEEEKDE